ncbi:hypothetical protein, partial [Providencia huaxiensis]|uniref:hypothetical protein n=1 Tax=Providencia huaxiensis TaxID=2027290 RepID=UPI0034E44AC9
FSFLFLYYCISHAISPSPFHLFGLWKAINISLPLIVVNRIVGTKVVSIMDWVLVHHGDE